jgi:hypothetical protein
LFAPRCLIAFFQDDAIRFSFAGIRKAASKEVEDGAAVKELDLSHEIGRRCKEGPRVPVFVVADCGGRKIQLHAKILFVHEHASNVKLILLWFLSKGAIAEEVVGVAE